MNISEKLKEFKILFENKKYDKVIDDIKKIENKNSVILNIYGVARLLRNDKNKKDKYFALEAFEKAYLDDKYSNHGLNALVNFINVGTELRKFEKIFRYYENVKAIFGQNEKLLEAIQRVYLFQHKVEERDKILKQIINNKTNSLKIWSSYLYNSNFLSNINSQKYHFDIAKDFEKILIDFNLPDLKIDSEIRKRKLKIGFLSADLNKNHSVVYFLKGLLENLDNSKFHLTAIANWKDKEFSNKQISTHFDNWFSIFNYNDLDAIKLIRSKKFDIIFDIMGMTSENRPTLFKNRIAPIQVNWLGYCNTSGIKKMDYIFADKNLINKAEEKYYYEKVKRFPSIWNVHSGYPFERNQNPQPSFNSNKFTFGSFNNFNKISNETLNSWESILKNSANSQLILKSSIEYFPDYYIQQFKKRGIDDKIKILTKSSSYIDHLNTYKKIDLSLDTFPYTGVTTTFDSLWNSVPVLTLKGYNFKSRCGYSIIKNLGIDYLIADNKEDYISKAVYLSNNPVYLKSLRDKLYINLSKSKLFDVKSFASDFEKLVFECVEEKLQSG